jgi:ssDNA-binding Zn-finger/Zn-ribbon topoisomerase 1
MKEVTMYQCEICGNLYNTSEEAQECESCGQPLVLLAGQRVKVQVIGYGEAKGTVSASRIGKGFFGSIPPYHMVFYRINPDSCDLGFVFANEEFPDVYVQPLIENTKSQQPQEERCPQCDNPVSRDMRQCPHCGASLVPV